MSHWLDDLARRSARANDARAQRAPQRDRRVSRRGLLTSAGLAVGGTLLADQLRLGGATGARASVCGLGGFACTSDQSVQNCYDEAAKAGRDAQDFCTSLNGSDPRGYRTPSGSGNVFNFLGCIAAGQQVQANAEARCSSQVNCCLSSPGATETCCHGQCVDTQTDPDNCGSCGHSCPGGIQCENGQCGGCPEGLKKCGGTCVDVTSDNHNCGSCGHVCVSPSICIGGHCTDKCPGGCDADNPICCENGCTDTKRDYFNCGGCGGACAAEIQENLDCCDGACTQLTSDQHCSECGNACGGDDGAGGKTTCCQPPGAGSYGCNPSVCCNCDTTTGAECCIVKGTYTCCPNGCFPDITGGYQCV